MADAATNRVTVDGLEMDLDDNGEIVRIWSEPAPSCEPTYAMSHRFGWPDARGKASCACRSWRGGHREHSPCEVHAPALPSRLYAVGAYKWVFDEYDGFDSQVMGDVDPVEAERQRCERLGVEWVGPDVQDGPVALHVLAQVVPSFPIREDLPVGDLVRLGCELREVDGVTAVR